MRNTIVAAERDELALTAAAGQLLEGNERLDDSLRRASGLGFRGRGYLMTAAVLTQLRASPLSLQSASVDPARAVRQQQGIGAKRSRGPSPVLACMLRPRI